MIRRLVTLTAVLMAVVACEDSTGPDGTSQIRIRLTDAPADYIESAEIWVSQVYLQRSADAEPEEEGEGGRVFLFDDAENPRHYDLMTLRDGVTADLTGEVEIEPGEYGQLRLVVDSAFVTLIEGVTFSDGTNTASLKVPSGSTSGIKVQLNEDLEPEEGETVDLIVDFDVNENFKIQGNAETPAGIHGILFTPVLKEKSRSVEEEV